MVKIKTTTIESYSRCVPRKDTRYSYKEQSTVFNLGKVMEPSYNFPQDDYALAILTQAAIHTEPTTGAPINTTTSTNYDISRDSDDRSTPSSLSRGLFSNQISISRTSTSSSSPRLSINQQPVRNVDSSLSHPPVARTTEILNGYGHGMETLGYPASQQRTHPYMNTSYHGIGSEISTYSTTGGSGLGILNAESYDDGRGRMSFRSLNEKTMATGHVMPFGVTETNGDMTESHEDEVERTVEKGGKRRRKRAAAEQNVEDAEEEARKKARGRPRVDTKDETAADVSVDVLTRTLQVPKWASCLGLCRTGDLRCNC